MLIIVNDTSKNPPVSKNLYINSKVFQIVLLEITWLGPIEMFKTVHVIYCILNSQCFILFLHTMRDGQLSWRRDFLFKAVLPWSPSNVWAMRLQVECGCCMSRTETFIEEKSPPPKVSKSEKFTRKCFDAFYWQESLNKLLWNLIFYLILKQKVEFPLESSCVQEKFLSL